ncbi:MAG: HAMP domain-containing sensor histidine kinase [Actinomycetota bacterium]
MTLRARIVLAVVVAGLTAAVGFGFVANRQQALLVEQLDVELRAVEGNVPRLPDFIGDVGPPGAVGGSGPPTGELYFAIATEDETTIVARPISEPDLEPDLDGVDLAALAGTGPLHLDRADAPGEVRAVVVSTSDNMWAVAALSTDGVDKARRSLLVTSIVAVAAVMAVLGLIWWWVDRLGIRPVLAVTTAAEEVAAGSSDRRVERRPVGTEAGRLADAFNAMLDARQEVEQRQRRFVADASHELRTPLTTLRGYAALYGRGGLVDPAEVDDAMRRIHAEAGRMAAIVDDLLMLASLDDERPLSFAAVDLTQLLVDIASDSAAIQPDRPIDFDGVADGLVVRADIDLLTQAIAILTTNALRHTPPEAGLTLRATALDGHAHVEVADHGPGIPRDELARLFDRFYRVDAGRTRGHGGTGLGLSIARSIVEAHGGSIAASSELDAGLTVRMTWPLWPSS